MMNYVCECVALSFYLYCFILYIHLLLTMKHLITAINSIHIKDTNCVCIYNIGMHLVYGDHTVLVGGAICIKAMIT